MRRRHIQGRRRRAADHLGGPPGLEIIRQHEGADPAAVVFDAASAAKARNTDVVLVDTAGRLHNKQNLMNELNKISRSSTGSCRAASRRPCWCWTPPQGRTD